MANSVWWIGSNGNTYVKTAGVNGVQDYGKLPAGSSIYGSKQIADPNPGGNKQVAQTASASASSGGGGGSSAPTIDRALIAQFDQSIGNTQAAINRLAGQEKSGQSEIESSYQNALNQLLLNRNREQGVYDTNKNNTAQEYVGAKNTIGANAGNALNSIMRLLGSRGAGGSSAGERAGEVVARDATLQRTSAGSTFAGNNRSLDTNWNNFLQDYDNQVSSAGNQRETQLGALSRQIQTNKASLLQSLAALLGQRASAAGGNPTGAAAPALAQANSILNSASNYTVNPISYKTNAYVAPELGKYTVNPAAAPQFNGQSASNDYVSPYLQALVGNRKQQQPAGA